MINFTKSLFRNELLAECAYRYFVPCCGLKYFKPPPVMEGIEFPEKNKLKFMEKVPVYPIGVRPPKMKKYINLMRGPELIHNELLHKQFGIIALCGGRLKYGHFEMIRLGITRKMDQNKMFAIWRVDPPWQPVTKKSPGKRLGGGKGNINHYVTPIRAGRVILEMGGHCEFSQVQDMLRIVAEKLPFKAMVVDQEIMDKRKQDEEREEKENVNPFTFKYIVQNNMLGCQNWISPYDREWFGKYR